MSKLEVSIKDKKGYIRDVVFLYTQIQSPVSKREEPNVKEYKTSIVVDEDTADAWVEHFPKNSYKKIKTSEFKEKFKIDPVFPNDKHHFVISVKAGAQFKGDWKEYQKGDLLPYGFTSRPKVYIPDGDGVKDVTLDMLIGNGSKGDLSFGINVVDKGKFPGTFPFLTAILVKDMIEYKKGDDVSAFGKVTNTVPREEKAKSPSVDNQPDDEYDDDTEDDPF